MRIRRLTKADIPSLVEIDRISFAADDQYDLRHYEEVIVSDAFKAIGVEDDSGNVVAWMLLDSRCKPIRMRSLAVHPDYSRRGLATALTNAVIDANGGPIDLLVEPQNDAAIALYEKLGFRVSEPGFRSAPLTMFAVVRYLTMTMTMTRRAKT
jgi:ribosomal protein S18 acetylase RimI-like enzyme